MFRSKETTDHCIWTNKCLLSLIAARQMLMRKLGLLEDWDTLGMANIPSLLSEWATGSCTGNGSI